jgi:hypothetical protein
MWSGDDELAFDSLVHHLTVRAQEYELSTLNYIGLKPIAKGRNRVVLFGSHCD